MPSSPAYTRWVCARSADVRDLAEGVATSDRHTGAEALPRRTPRTYCGRGSRRCVVGCDQVGRGCDGDTRACDKCPQIWRLVERQRPRERHVGPTLAT